MHDDSYIYERKERKEGQILQETNMQANIRTRSLATFLAKFRSILE
jgi:hypothetical protein